MESLRKLSSHEAFNGQVQWHTVFRPAQDVTVIMMKTIWEDVGGQMASKMYVIFGLTEVLGLAMERERCRFFLHSSPKILDGTSRILCMYCSTQSLNLDTNDVATSRRGVTGNDA